MVIPFGDASVPVPRLWVVREHVRRRGRGTQVQRVLVVDDEPRERAFVSELISRAGYDAREAASVAEMRDVMWIARPDLLILETCVLGDEAWATVERLRTWGVPILVLTRSPSEEDRTRAGTAGAMGYMTKPFDPQVLLARIAAVLQPAWNGGGHPSFEDRLLSADFATQEVTINGNRVELSPLELRFLSALLADPGRVLTVEELVAGVWAGAGSATTVKITASRLRGKLRAAGAHDDIIYARRGSGYQYREVP
jgi:DNA-binding response OmpR family regulator